MRVARLYLELYHFGPTGPQLELRLIARLHSHVGVPLPSSPTTIRLLACFLPLGDSKISDEV